MARGSIGRERMISGVVNSNLSHQPGVMQEDLNNELLAVSTFILKYSQSEQRNLKKKSYQAIYF
jgi:hypothetical protein